MASPPSSREEPRSPLPAPYEDPWRRLAADLAALAATARLKARELWRLNGEGALDTPVFWPRGQASLFWPLVLALGVTLVVGLTLRLPGWRGGLPADPGAELTAAVAPASRQAEQRRGEVDGAEATPPDPVAMPADSDSAAEPAMRPQPVDQDGASGDRPAPWPRRQGPGGDQTIGEAGRPGPRTPGSGPAADPAAAASSLIVPADSDPGASGNEPGVGSPADKARSPTPSLLAELVGADPPDWVLGLEPSPAEGLLRLRLAGGFGALPLAERRTLAERWLARCRDLGYEHLDLVSPSGNLLAKTARVGSGMILLDPVVPPR